MKINSVQTQKWILTIGYNFRVISKTYETKEECLFTYMQIGSFGLIVNLLQFIYTHTHTHTQIYIYIWKMVDFGEFDQMMKIRGKVVTSKSVVSGWFIHFSTYFYHIHTHTHTHIYIYIYIYILPVKSISPPSKIFISHPKSFIFNES